MARELRRLLIVPDRLAQAAQGADGAYAGLRVPLLERERHYLARVLRLRSGDRVAVVNGCGALWSAVIEAGDALVLEQSLLAPLEHQPAAGPPLQLALALPRRDVELVWRMATELGIDQLQPLGADRCVERGQAPLERWRSVVTEASEQCERLWMPVLEQPRQALAWLAEGPGPEAPAAAGPGRRFLATTRRENLQLLPQALGSLVPGEEAVTVAVGPEGGWSPEEEGAAADAGWCPVSLGPLILRSGTAAVAAAVQLASWRSLSF